MLEKLQVISEVGFEKKVDSWSMYLRNGRVRMKMSKVIFLNVIFIIFSIAT